MGIILGSRVACDPSFFQNSRWASPGHGLDHVHVSIDRWVLSLGIRVLDKLIDTNKEAKASQPPSQTFGGTHMLTIKIECQFGCHTIVPHTIMILDQLQYIHIHIHIIRDRYQKREPYHTNTHTRKTRDQTLCESMQMREKSCH
jgi:hypothetical protein